MATAMEPRGTLVGDRHAAPATHDWRHDWRKGMSDNVATALVVYTGLQIFVTVSAMKKGLDSITPYLALIVLVAAIIPACRRFEARWAALSDAEAHDPAFRGAYRRDQALLWLIAIGLPFALTFGFRALFAFTG